MRCLYYKFHIEFKNLPNFLIEIMITLLASCWVKISIETCKF